MGDAQSFDIAAHVPAHRVPPPGDEEQLLLACETLRRRPLHRARPLWEMWFLTGLPEDRVGFFMKMHHAIADGVAGVATLAAFVDPVPDPPEMKPSPNGENHQVLTIARFTVTHTSRWTLKAFFALIRLIATHTAAAQLGPSMPTISNAITTGRTARAGPRPLRAE